MHVNDAELRSYCRAAYGTEWVRKVFDTPDFGEQITAMHEECQRRWAVHLQMIADLKAIAWLAFWFFLAWFSNG